MRGETMVYRPHDPHCNENGMVPKSIASPLINSDLAPMIISDLQDYRTVAVDRRTGKRANIGGRRQHREFLKANGYVELGNDYVPPRRDEMTRADRIGDIRRVMGD